VTGIGHFTHKLAFINRCILMPRSDGSKT
jgi:hypothetical protein